MTKQKGGNGSDELTVNFDYIKSQHFRVIRADGAIGAITPEGIIHFALYSERPAIPRQIFHRMNSDGSLGEEITEQRVSRGGIVREMDVDVFLTLPVAKNLNIWLQARIKELEKRQTQANKKKGN